MSDTRRGSTFVDLLVALPLFALAMATVLLLLAQAARERRGIAAGHRGLRELRAARHLLAQDLLPLRGRDLLAWRDTLLTFRSHLGTALVCGSQGNVVEVAAAPGDGAATRWIEALRAADRLEAWRAAPAAGGEPIAVHLVLVATPVRLAAATCGAVVADRRWRLTVNAAVPDLQPGGPLLALRDVQYVHYRSGAHWWLGRRAWDGAGWEVVQPIAGPLESPARGGMRIRVVAADARLLAAGDSAAVVRVQLRAPPTRLPSSRLPPSNPSPVATRRLPLVVDSAELTVALRAAAWRRGSP